MRPLSYFENRSWKDEATGCWNWTLYAYPNGYGGFTDPAVKRTLSTHRGAWIAANGPIPEGKVVCHRCDNKLCCNPDHLFLGTQSDNIKDMVAKGRGDAPKGSRHHNARLTEHDVGIIKMLLGLGVKQQRMAALYGVCHQSVSDIHGGRTWRHVQAVTP